VPTATSASQPNAHALALTPHPTSAGTAAALLGVTQFTLGAALAPLVGIHGHTALPMAIVIGFCGLASVLALRKLVPSRLEADSTTAVEALSIAL